MRRSNRVTALAAKAEKEKLLMERVEAGADEGLVVMDAGEKGRGVAAAQQFHKGDYVCTYQGELISQKTMLER